jgi:hypothetical protein
MLAGALAVHYLSTPIPVAQPRYVPIERFPAQVGHWTLSAVLPIPQAVRLKLPTAHIVDRMYTDPQGQAVELMLLTATRRDDMHDPARCLPSQGWNVTAQRRIRLGNQIATALTIEQDGSSADAYYWLTGYYEPARDSGSLQTVLERVRGHIVNRQQGMSLFVRLMTADNPTNAGALDDFARQITPLLDQIKAASLRPGERVDLSNGEAVSRA